MQSDFLFKRNESISRFLSRLRALAMKNTSVDRLEKEINSFVFKFLPSVDSSDTLLSSCLQYALSFRDFTLNENNIRLFSDF